MATEYILPSSDVSDAISKGGAGSGCFDRLNAGIESDAPDDSNFVYGLDEDNCRLGFPTPSFAGTSTAIIVRARGWNVSDANVRIAIYSDGDASDGDFTFDGGAAAENQEQSFVIAKTAAQLADLEVSITCYSTDDDDYISEIEVEITYTSAAVGINIGDDFKDLDELQINIGDVWKDVTEVKINIGDDWKDVF